MAIASTSSSQAISSGIFAQIQQQQAQRNADQAENQARALQGQARDAQAVASRAQDNARSLKIQSEQAQGEAADARQGLSTAKSYGESKAKLSDVLTRVNETLKRSEVAVKASVKTQNVVDAAPVALAPAPVVNVFGQQTGTMVNVTA
jgi:hypothetical protein